MDHVSSTYIIDTNLTQRPQKFVSNTNKEGFEHQRISPDKPRKLNLIALKFGALNISTVVYIKVYNANNVGRKLLILVLDISANNYKP